MRWVGKLSYSLYLWHWPLIVVATYRLDGLTVPQGLAVVAVSFLPAYVSFRYVEDPVRRSQAMIEAPVRALELGVVCTVAGIIAGVGLGLANWPPPPPVSSASTTQKALPDAASEVERFGALVLPANPRGAAEGEPVDQVDSIMPDPLNAREDFTDCLGTDINSSEIVPCPYGPVNADVQVAVLGDSHVQQWLPAITPLAEERGWRITAYTKGSCPFTSALVEYDRKPYDSCTEWNKKAQAVLADADLDLVITSSLTRSTIADGELLSADDPGENGLAAGFVEAWAPLVARSIPILVIRDNPRPGIDMAECVSANRSNLTECAGARADYMLGRGDGQLQAVQRVPEATMVDLTDAICPANRCAPVIGGVLVYRDTDHLTATYAYSLAPRLVAHIDQLLQPAG